MCGWPWPKLLEARRTKAVSELMEMTAMRWTDARSSEIALEALLAEIGRAYV